MIVAIDGTPLATPPGGIRRYTEQLHRALEQAFPADNFQLVSDQFDRPKSWLRRRWWSWGVERTLNHTGAQVFHGTDFTVPYRPRRPSVMTIHDLSPWQPPHDEETSARIRSRTPVLMGLGLATMIITPSEATRRALIERFRIAPARVAVTPLAAAPHLRPVAGPPAERPYLLYLGVVERRKNVETIVQAWREVRERMGCDLVIAGRHREPGLVTPEPGVRVLGEVAEDRLPELYSGAIACLYPSLYEGFGLPVLEAMQCGCPVIASRDAAVVEATGGAGLHCDARDARQWAEAMQVLAADPERREALRAAGESRAREFSWPRTAALTHAVYREAVNRY
ncbi:MAG: glycosyltransferase family 4 protein [Acidobacteria bacterium]|nr:glycosyltransferase family 4 protein [Acidobacteriota bacterium]